jgi:hypothetical protein
LLVAFGGPVGGLQEAIEADQDLKVGGDDAAELFDLFIDPNAKSGTRTVRLEVNINKKKCKTNRSLYLLTL